MLRAALISAVLTATLAAAAVTLDDLDPLTRGICEQLHINRQCPILEPPTEREPKRSTVIRPKPRPDWCQTSQSWRFVCFDMEALYAPEAPYHRIGREPSPGSASGESHGIVFGGSNGGSGGDASVDAFAWAVRSSRHAASRHLGVLFLVDGDGLQRPVDRPDEPEVIPLPGALWLMLGALAGLGLVRRAWFGQGQADIAEKVGRAYAHLPQLLDYRLAFLGPQLLERQDEREGQRIAPLPDYFAFVVAPFAHATSGGDEDLRTDANGCSEHTRRMRLTASQRT